VRVAVHAAHVAGRAGESWGCTGGPSGSPSESAIETAARRRGLATRRLAPSMMILL
jgi:hypothetical protein